MLHIDPAYPDGIERSSEPSAAAPNAALLRLIFKLLLSLTRLSFLLSTTKKVVHRQDFSMYAISVTARARFWMVENGKEFLILHSSFYVMKLHHDERHRECIALDAERNEKVYT